MKRNKNWKEKLILTGFIVSRALVAIPVHAAVMNTGITELDDMVNTVLNLLAGIVSGYGVIKLINGVRAWSDGNEEMDQARKTQGMNTILSGLICVSVFPILQVLGFVIG